MTTNLPNATENFVNTKLTEEEISKIKIFETIHLLGNFLSFGLVSILGILFYVVTEKNLSPNVRKTGYNIINFNINFIFIIQLFVFIAIKNFSELDIIAIILIAFFTLLLFFVWIIITVVGAISHFSGNNYNYPAILKILK